VTESPKKVAIQTARALAAKPEILVAACAHVIAPERAEEAIEHLAYLLELAIKRCMCRDYPKGD
jgi:hypothetical protein